MSTKALFELCRQFIQFGTPEQQALAHPAMRELSAIERAAFCLFAEDVIPESTSSYHGEEARKAIALFRGIANVEPWGRE